MQKSSSVNNTDWFDKVNEELKKLVKDGPKCFRNVNKKHKNANVKMFPK